MKKQPQKQTKKQPRPVGAAEPRPKTQAAPQARAKTEIAAQEAPAAAAMLKALAADKTETVAVIGGGAAGMAAAIAAARTAKAQSRAVRVVLLEKADRVGRKLLATGNGRCNLGHEPVCAENYATWQRSAASQAALAAFLAARSAGGSATFLESLGLLVREEEGRLYPYCGQASMVLDVLRAALQTAGVITVCGCGVSDIIKTEGGFIIRTDTAGQPLPALFAGRVILAVGGAAAPKLGGCRDGCALASALGHSCTPLAPALVGLRCAIPAPEKDGRTIDVLPGLKGIRAQAAASLYDGEILLASDIGEVQFNETGLSGIPVLQLSLRAPQAKDPRIALDLLPQLPQAELTALLDTRCVAAVTLEDLLLGTVHKKLGYAVMKCAGLGALSRRADTLSAPERQRLCALLKYWPVTVKGHQGWDGAQVALGGVSLEECIAETCASRLCEGLFLAGEVLDCAGECGGFNLDWAFTTGVRAGEHAVLSLAEE